MGEVRAVLAALFLCGLVAPASAASSNVLPAMPASRFAAIDSLLADSRYEMAETMSREALAALESEGAPDSLRAAVLDRLVRALLGAGRWNDPNALGTARDAVRLKEAVYGPRHGEVALSLISLGWMLYRGGSWEEAKPVVERALDVSEASHGPRHRSVVRSLHLLAGIVEEAGEFARAESLYQRELDVSIALWGDESVEAANTRNSLAVLYRKTGRFALARPLYERALASREKALGRDHADVGWSLNNYAILLGNMGDWTRARELYERALEIRRKRSGPDHPAVALGYNNLGTALSALGDSARAEKAFLTALETQIRSLAPDHPDRAMTLQNLGLLWTGQGRFHEADTALAGALAIRETRFGRRSTPVAATLAAQGALSLARGKADQALPRFEEAVAIAEELEIPESELMTELLVGHAEALAAAGRDSASFDVAIRAQRLIVRRIRTTTRVLDERSALGYGGTRGNALGTALSLASRARHDDARVRAAFDALISSRALVLDELAERHRAVRSSEDPEVSRLREALRRAREDLAYLVVHAASAGGSPRRRAHVLEATRRREQAEAALAERSAAYREERARAHAGLDEVARALERGDALVAYVRFRSGVGGGGAPARTDGRYGAFLLRAGDSAGPRWIAIGDAAAVERAARAWRSEAARRPGALSRAGDERRCRERGTAFRKLVWDPIASRLGGVRRVFIVPDGILHEVNLAALPVSGGRYLAEESALLHLLVTERDLVSEPSSTSGRGVLAMGAPNYERAEEPSGSRIASLGAASAATMLPDGIAAYRGPASSCVDFAQLQFEPLPATKAELQSIASVWKKPLRDQPSAEPAASVEGEPLVSLSGTEATEDAFKRAAPGRRVVHLATHGFFIGARCGSSGTRGSTEHGGITESPLLRSGLALAGANRRAAAPAGEQDGVLTAEEMSAVDLSGVEWVVLSACDTGRGEERAHEGVLGLRRAVQISGARTVVMSLWAVDDRSTAEWMERLYRNRLVQSNTTSEAVRSANRSVLRVRRARGLSDHPFYWAGFVAAGDWR